MECFEQWLALAKEGKLNYCSVVGTSGTEDISMSYAGNPGMLRVGLTGIDMLRLELLHRHETRKLGPRDLTLDDSYHEYNLATDPLNHDFMVYLVDAEMHRVRCGAPAPLKIGFSHPEECSDTALRFVQNVFRPLIHMLGAVEDKKAIGGKRVALFTPSEIVLRSRQGEKVPLYKAPEEDFENVKNRLNGRFPVTITLREYRKWEKRNSNVPEWIKFAKELRSKGEDVIFVRDTERANEPLEDFATFPQASFYTKIRMALYEQAKCNFFVSNGPAGLGIWGSRPYLYFLTLYRDEEYEANNPDWWPAANGIGAGEQWPWALPSQRMVWKEDTYWNLCEAWEGHRDKI